MPTRYEVVYSPESLEDLKSLRLYDQRAVIDAIEQTLPFAPTTETKSSVKRMEQPFWCQFRLRVDDLRVYYNVYQDEGRVSILRIIKKGTEVTPEVAS